MMNLGLDDGFFFGAKPRRQQPLVSDDFAGPAAGPLVSPRACVPGPGSWLITDTQSKLSVSSGNLVMAPKSPSENKDPGLWSSIPYPKRPGLCLHSKYTWPNGSAQIGFATKALAAINGPAIGMNGINPLWGTIGIYSAGSTYEAAIVVRGESRTFYLIKGNFWGTNYSDWGLLRTSNECPPSSLHAALANNSSTMSVDFLRVYYLGGRWEQEDGAWWFAQTHRDVTSDGLVLTGLADCYLEHTITAQTGVTQELRFRYTDDDNCWILRADQTGGKLYLVQRQAAVETIRLTLNQTWTAGAKYTLAVRAEGQHIMMPDYTGGNYNSATFNQTSAGVKISHAGEHLAVWNLRSGWDLTQGRSQYPSRPHCFLAFGDSKTVGQNDTSPPASGSNGWPYQLTIAANAVEFPARMCYSGAKTHDFATVWIDQWLAAATGVPEAILYNVGANDTAVDATWKAETAAIWDKMHAKYPNAKIYATRIWRRSQPMSLWNSMAAAQDELIAARATWCFAGIDERVLLENGDDGVTFTTDGVHPNHAGHVREAQAWKSLLRW